MLEKFLSCRFVNRNVYAVSRSSTEPSADRYESSTRPHTHALLPKLIPWYRWSYFLCVAFMQLATFLDLLIIYNQLTCLNWDT